jgi:uncharacterized protein (DUF427 family)
MKAKWNNRVIAESDDVVTLEGNVYFPLESVNKEFLKESSTKIVCPWKGEASYYNLLVEDAINPDAAWYYADPSPQASQIKGRVAFWKGVQVTGD